MSEKLFATISVIVGLVIIIISRILYAIYAINLTEDHRDLMIIIALIIDIIGTYIIILSILKLI